MKLIFISGPSGSGKTTLSNKLIKKNNNGFVLSTDNYYKTGLISKLLSKFVKGFFDRNISFNYKLFKKDFDFIYKNGISICDRYYNFEKKTIRNILNETNNISFLIVEGIFAKEFSNTLNHEDYIFFEIKTKNIQLSNLPDYFGVDRALACIAALKIIENPLKKDLLIADFGTILSITKLNSNGSIIGGQLLPGFLTQLKSMEQNTKNLKVPKKYDIPIKDFLINTEEAILKGVINSLTGVLNSLFNPEKDILIICGGDSQLLTNSIKTKKENIINAPNLVMEGMIIHHLSIKKLA